MVAKKCGIAKRHDANSLFWDIVLADILQALKTQVKIKPALAAKGPHQKDQNQISLVNRHANEPFT